MKVRDIVIGIIFLAIITALIIVVARKTRITPKLLPTPTPSPSVQQNIERRFNVTIPPSVEKAELSDVSGGNGEGVATREKQGTLNVYTILANLEDPQKGQFYQGWLIRGKSGDSNYAVVSMGKLRVAKGGWLGEFQSSADYSDYINVVVSLETKSTTKPTKHILEGSF